jgi:hypothetical protein
MRPIYRAKLNAYSLWHKDLLGNGQEYASVAESRAA